jgi:hypothetical protein
MHFVIPGKVNACSYQHQRSLGQDIRFKNKLSARIGLQNGVLLDLTFPQQ